MGAPCPFLPGIYLTNGFKGPQSVYLSPGSTETQILVHFFNFYLFLFGANYKSVYFCRPFRGNKSDRFTRKGKKGPVAQLNRAFDYGSKGFWFESRRGHERSFTEMWSFFYALSSIE
jgi:hypothetical protein